MWLSSSFSPVANALGAGSSTMYSLGLVPLMPADTQTSSRRLCSSGASARETGRALAARRASDGPER
jgi:hypothetical protein